MQSPFKYVQSESDHCIFIDISKNVKRLFQFKVKIKYKLSVRCNAVIENNLVPQFIWKKKKKVQTSNNCSIDVQLYVFFGTKAKL